MKKTPFICNQNENRSKFAEHLFKDEFETGSAGLYKDKRSRKNSSSAIGAPMTVKATMIQRPSP